MVSRLRNTMSNGEHNTNTNRRIGVVATSVRTTPAKAKLKRMPARSVRKPPVTQRFHLHNICVQWRGPAIKPIAPVTNALSKTVAYKPKPRYKGMLESIGMDDNLLILGGQMA